MASISTGIELHDGFTNVLYGIINSVNMAISSMEDMQSTMNTNINASAFENMRSEINQATIALDELNQAIANQASPDAVPDVIPETAQPEPATAPVQWQTEGLEVFTGSGVERFQQEVQSTNAMLQQLNSTQDEIARQAYNTNLLPPEAAQNLNSLAVRIDTVRDRIQQIENNPMNFGTDEANAELEQLRAQLAAAINVQNDLNRAMQDMDVSSANDAYLRLSRIVSDTERHIRDNVDEQGRFNREIQGGADYADKLRSMIAGAVGAFVGIAGIKKAFDFVEDCTEAFNTQLNAETQLISVLSNMLDEDYVAQFELETTADTDGAINGINAIQDSVSEVVVPVSAESRALTTAFNQITEKASEIQSRGIYGDESMIAAAAEFSTYFTDTDAIEMMMDTLADYAIGMSGGGEVGSQQMVDYATNLGKIMSGAYDAMTKKGFELSDTQKAIIEGTATQEQIVSALGEEYINMSQDMQAAAAISQVIEESWSGLYESMSNTPEGKIIQMNNAWGDMKEVIGGQLYPYVILFVDAITENWSTIEGVVQGITTGLEFLLGMLSWLLEGAIAIADAVVENWSWISPIIYGVAAALAVYYGWQFLCAAASGIMQAAQLALNAVMMANPVMLVVLAIIALIAIFYAAVAAVNKFTGTSVSATGIICGAFMVALAFIGNIFIALWNLVVDVFVLIYNLVAEVANFIGNVFDDPIAAVCRLFFGFADTVLGILQALASAIDAIFGSNLAASVQGWRDSLGGWVDETFGKGDEIMAKMNADDMKLGRFEYGEAWDAGYSFGEGIDESIANFDPSSLFGITDVPSPEDYASSLTAGGIGEGVEDIADNTGAIKDSLDISNEDLKYLRDIAEREEINRFTTAAITVEMNNNNSITNVNDLDGIMDGLATKVIEAIEVVQEGV